MPHAFRWLDHVQHLPGIWEQVQAKGLVVSFPDENAQPPSNKQLKKLAKKNPAEKEAPSKKPDQKAA